MSLQTKTKMVDDRMIQKEGLSIIHNIVEDGVQNRG